MIRRHYDDFVLRAEVDVVVLYNTRCGDWQEVERFAPSPTLEQVRLAAEGYLSDALDWPS